MQAKTKPRRGRGNKQAVLGYVIEHPGCRSADIMQGLGLPATNVGYNLGLLKKEKAVEMLGSSRQATWRSRHKPAPVVGEPEENPDPAEEAKKPFKCDLCPKRFHVKGSLLSHMRLVHHAGSV